MVIKLLHISQYVARVQALFIAICCCHVAMLPCSSAICYCFLLLLLLIIAFVFRHCDDLCAQRLKQRSNLSVIDDCQFD